MDLHDFGIVAQHYDSYVKTFSSEDQQKEFVDFHLGFAASYGRDGILDCACGTGRIAIPLLEAGHTVFAFDISEAMVRRLLEKLNGLDFRVRQRANISVQNMADFSHERVFSVAMIPASGFMHLLTPEDQRRALLNINRHLSPEGVLTLNTFDPDPRRIAGSSDDRKDYRERTEFATADGHRMEIHESMSYHPETQAMEGFWRFIEYDNDGRILSESEVPLRMRYTFRQEMHYLLELCGFRVEALYGSYGRAAPRYPSPLIWVARKAKHVEAA